MLKGVTIQTITIGYKVQGAIVGLHGYLNFTPSNAVVTVARAIHEEDEVNTVNIGSTDNWPLFGFFRIDDEDFYYFGKDHTSLLDVQRAQNNTKPGFHDLDTMVKFMGTLMTFEGYEEDHTFINITEHTPTVATLSHGVPVQFVNAAIEGYKSGVLTVSSTVGFPDSGFIDYHGDAYSYTLMEGTKKLSVTGFASDWKRATVCSTVPTWMELTTTAKPCPSCSSRGSTTTS